MMEKDTIAQRLEALTREIPWSNVKEFHLDYKEIDGCIVPTLHIIFKESHNEVQKR